METTFFQVRCYSCCLVRAGAIHFLFIPPPFAHTAHSPSFCLPSRNNPRPHFSKRMEESIPQKKHVYYLDVATKFWDSMIFKFYLFI